MGLSKNFPSCPYSIPKSSSRWTPDKDDSEQKKSLPPLVEQVRQEVEDWRNKGYPGLSRTTNALFEHWFETIHFLSDGSDFRYFFSQRESVESIVYIYEIKKFRNLQDLLYFDRTKSINPIYRDETWLRLVCKQATGTGKTKVLSLLITWCYFHKKYERDSELSTNFLLITPNIIVLDRIRSDFDGLRIFSQDPLIPKDGFYEKNWKSDFRMTLHIQDDLKPKSSDGNIFLSNIHRVYEKTDSEPSIDDDNVKDYFIGKPVSKTIDSKHTLSGLVRGIDDLVVLNDEAHHIHDSKLSWFSSIRDIQNNLLQRGGKLSIQIDVTATPKKPDGSIFPHVISDYPLVEAIAQGVVKTPVIPDEESRAVLKMKETGDFAEDHASFLDLGVVEWKKAFQYHNERGKKAVLFVMVDETKNCEKVKIHLESRHKELTGKVFVIHTKKDGSFYESSTSKKESELKDLRKTANEIDNSSNHYRAIVSVLMLKEGWDVKNVTTIVGLRSYTSKSKILPEQTLGRGLRRMYSGRNSTEEKLSVIGTPNFMEFVEQIKHDGVVLNEEEMGPKHKYRSLIIKVDHENPLKNISDLNITIPILNGRIQFSHQSIKCLELDSVMEPKDLINFGDNKAIEVCFENFLEGTHSHHSKLPKDFEIDAHHVLKYLTDEISTSLNLFGENAELYEKLKLFVSKKLFGHTVKLDEHIVVRNILRPGTITELINAFRKAIVKHTAKRVKPSEITSSINLSPEKEFAVKNTLDKYQPLKCVFNYIAGDSTFEIEFAKFLDNAPDIVSFTKCFRKLDFKLEYVDCEGKTVDYFPDFIIRLESGETYVVETKGDYHVDQNTEIKRNRLIHWCINASELTDTPWKEAFILFSLWRTRKHQLFTFEDLLRLTSQDHIP